MKVVLFCGGLGIRLHPDTVNVPKPLVLIGGKPVLWHLMKYYSYFGHKDFILCLGYKGEAIKKFFLNYDECLSSDFIFSNGGRTRQLLDSDIEDWRITFADTSVHSNVGQRLKAVQKYLEGEEMFLANYSDGLSDLPLPKLINFFIDAGKTGCFVAVKPFYSFHIISLRADGCVKSVSPVSQSNLRINGGFFVFKNKIFDYIKDGEDLVNEPFQRLIQKDELVAYDCDGFWASLDTYKDKQRLDELASKNNAFWEIWNHKS
ncbi:MAG: glucose-1-phosphate cytidylyltransferase [Candidatus Bathyarchaeota archaeon]|nr:MAG: glucose-1-phosphate cytidylyltransferase [Candidatus Bathyarchaeota archaeon]